jgi:hypothetical protein
VLALALALVVILERPSERGRRIYVVGTVVAVALAALSCVPPSDFRTFAQGLGNTSQFGSGPTVRLLSSVAGFWRAAVPVPDGSGAWNSNVFDPTSGAVVVQALAGLIVFFVVLRALRSSRIAARLWCIGGLGCLVFSLVVILPERYRYAGTAFLLLVACAWLGWRSVVPRRPLAIAFGAILVCQVVATVAVLPAGVGTRFSPDRAIADVIRHEAPHAAIVSGADYDALTVAGYLDRPVYSVARRAWTRYFVHDARQQRGTAHLDAAEVLCEARALAERSGRPVVAFVAAKELPSGARQLTEAGGVGVLLVQPGAGSGCST